MMKLPRYLRGKSAEGGFLLIMMLVQGLAVMTVLTGVMTLGLYNMSAAKRSTYITSATYAAEAGGDYAMYRINADSTYTGTNTTCPIGTAGSNPVTLYSNTTGRATYENCVTAGTITNEKIVYAVGKVYVPASSTVAKATKTVKLVVIGTPSGNYALQTGPGGLTLTNGATITSGPVYIGGFLTVIQGAQIGTSASPVNVNVANQRCPVPVNATWPQLCASGTQNNPITISNGGEIYGDVKANGQVVPTGMSSPGLTASSGVGSVTLPDYDRAAHKAAATTTLTSANASCSSGQAKSWAANVHITGNVALASGCEVTVNGNAWIDGSLTLSSGGKLKIASSLTARPIIMIDGSGGVSVGSGSSINANAGSIGGEFITFYNTCGLDCASVTGTALNTSMNTTTISLGTGSSGASSVFYARWSGLELDTGASYGSLLGQKMLINTGGNITLGGTAAGAASGYTWDVRYYESL